MASVSQSINTSPYFSKQLQRFGLTALITLFTSIILAVFLIPFVYMALTSIKTKEQIVASATGSIFPVSNVTVEFEGQKLDIVIVPLENGEKRELALYKKGRQESTFLDPENLSGEPIVWQGSWRTLKAVQEFDPKFESYNRAWTIANFPRLIFNTSVIAGFGVVGTLMSSICVAYAFARFPIPAKNMLFLILVGTIILPRQVMLVPTYAFFNQIGWTGTWLPLIVPHFFSNAYNVFLLRQYFLALPRELDEAAMIDGAGPFRILISVIIPQSYPVIVAVALFHLVFAWNDYFEPLIYTLGKPELQPISVGIQQFNFRYDQEPHTIQATALLGMSLPVMLFFVAQRFFIQGIVVTGVDK